MKLKSFIFCCLLFSTDILYAQTDFRPGYVIENSGDTLHGKIDYRSDFLMSSICKFKTNENTIIKFSPKDIIAYRFIEGKYFVSREINSKRVFLEYLIKGKVNIYNMRDETGDHYFLDKEEVKLTELPYVEGIKYIDDKQVFYNTTKHIGILNYYMQDAPDFQSRIAKIGKPEHYSLIKLAEDYHNTLCKDIKCIVFEKKVPFLKIAFEPFFGFGEFNRTYSDIGSFYSVGANILLWGPKLNEKVYFKTGLVYSKYNKGHFYKFPLQIQYIFPLKRIRPTVSIGLDLYYNHLYIGSTLHISGGFIYKIRGRTFFSTSISSEFPSIIILAIDDSKMRFGVFAYSLNVGLHYTL